MIRLHDEKNIDSIFFYAINDNKNYLGFFYTSNNKKYKVDYKDVNFKESVDRIIYVYNILKDVKKVNLIGDLTQDVINGKLKISDNKLYNKTLINTEKYDFESMIDYIKLIIESTFKSLNNNNIFNNNSTFIFDKSNIVGINNNYCIKIPMDNIELEIPISFYKYGNGYKLKYRIFNGYKDYLFDCDIKNFDKSIIVQINNREYNGEIIFDKLNIDNSIIFKKNNRIVCFNNLENDLKEEDINIIQKVFNMINFKGNIIGIKSVNNNYILYDSNENFEYQMKLNIHDDLIRINLKQNNKYNMDNIDFKVEEEIYDIYITKYDDRNILVQQKYLICENSNSEFKKNINRSRYFILHTTEDIKSLADSNIAKKIEINYPIENIKEIDSFTYKYIKD